VRIIVTVNKRRQIKRRLLFAKTSRIGKNCCKLPFSNGYGKGKLIQNALAFYEPSSLLERFGQREPIDCVMLDIKLGSHAYAIDFDTGIIYT